MRLRGYFVIPTLLSILAVGQVGGSAPSVTQTPIKGVKIKSASFDAQTRVATLAFINDSPADITAWGYCIKAQTAPGSLVRHDFCTSIDALPTVAASRIEQRKKPFVAMPHCHGCDVIHPGQEETISFDVSGYPDVIGASIELNLVAFSNGTSSVARDDAGKLALRALTQSRRESLRAVQSAIETARAVLADRSDTHPAATMIRQLEATGDPALASLIESFKKPDKAKGDDREFIPEKEREYLLQFVKDQEMRAVLFSGNQIKEAL